jgi:hypothetical protein
MRRVALVSALVLAVVPATSASPSQQGAVTGCQAGPLNYSPAPAARPGDLALGVKVHSEQAVGESPSVLWTLTLRNRTFKTVGVTYPTSQYAGVVLRRRGKVAYSWARGRGFFQAFSARTLGPKEKYVCTLGPDAINVEGLEQGRYELFAYLNAYRLNVESHGWFSVH